MTYRVMTEEARSRLTAKGRPSMVDSGRLRGVAQGALPTSAIARVRVARWADVQHRERPYTTTGRWLATGVVWLLAWSLSYLLRQAVPYPAQPFALLGDFALEGILLSLTWLAIVVGFCLALVSEAA